jgi:hypothetical protein
MNIRKLRTFTSISFSLALAVLTVTLATAQASAQCNTLITGLREPLGTALSNQGNLLVSETGTPAPNSGRISILDADGNRRTLLDGFPSAINDVGEPSGPAGLFMRGRTLYVAIGVGDVGRAGPLPGTTIPNPAGPSSPLFSSVLAIQFSANAEKITTGFTLTPDDQQALADGQTVTLSNGGVDRITIRLIANFPNFISFPLPFFSPNIKLSNPFQLVAVEDELYVTDGGRNLVWHIDLLDGSFTILASFPPIPNPVSPIGGPVLDAVPTGIAAVGDQLLVTLFRGFPFPPGVSTVEQIDPLTGNDTALISGLRTAIDVLPATADENASLLVLQHTSGTAILPPPNFSGPGLVLRFDSPAGPPIVVANCLTRPTTMTLDKKAGTLYVSEYGGRVVAVPFAP